MADVLAWVSIVLSAVSITLAITAIVFGWVTFLKSLKMQAESSTLLSQVSHKVEVISERTSSQLDKAWDYLTKGSIELKDELSERMMKEIEQVRSQMVDEARKEATALIEKTGLDKVSLQSTVKAFQDVVGRVAVKSNTISEVTSFLDKYHKIELMVRRMAERLAIEFDEKSNIVLILDKCEERIPEKLPSGLKSDLNMLLRQRNRISHGIDMDISEVDLHEYSEKADSIRIYLQFWFGAMC